MSEPAREFLRRGEVIAWLEEKEFTAKQVRKLIEDEVIEGRPFKEWFRVTPPAANGKNGSVTKGKAKAKDKRRHRQEGDVSNYFRKSQIKEALKI